METVRDSITDFLFHCQYEKRLSIKTLKAYKIDLHQFQQFLELKKINLLKEIDKVELKLFIKFLQDSFKARTAKRKIACLKALFNYIEFDDEEFINPFRKIKIQVKEPFRIPTVLDLTEATSIFHNVYNLKKSFSSRKQFSYRTLVRDIAILELLFASGLRVSELTNLQKSNINIITGDVRVIGKGNKERIIQICNKDVISALQEYENLFSETINQNTYYFVNRSGRRFSEQSVRIIVKKYASMAKVGKHVTPHTFRHTFATMLLDEGVDIRYIQIILGHSSILTTQIYTHVSSSKQKQILSEKHPRNRLKVA